MHLECRPTALERRMAHIWVSLDRGRDQAGVWS
jgi:hypothetical protein